MYESWLMVCIVNSVKTSTVNHSVTGWRCSKFYFPSARRQVNNLCRISRELRAIILHAASFTNAVGNRLREFVNNDNAKRILQPDICSHILSISNTILKIYGCNFRRVFIIYIASFIVRSNDTKTNLKICDNNYWRKLMFK